MASFVKFYAFAGDLMQGLHDLQAAGDVVKVYLTNAAPSVSADSIKTDLAEISAENGYPAGGTDIQNDVSESGGTASMTGVDVVFTASGGTFGPFRYAVLYNDTATDDPLIGYWDYGSSITPADPETFTVDFTTTIIDIT
ncbi:unnamed protein product [marine sediment metagenome]|uniref:Uncharacterized protein n=1 Tax=marine sediment metagenome TaxID=412755 RepID=X0S7E9_9ZZZZ